MSGVRTTIMVWAYRVGDDMRAVALSATSDDPSVFDTEDMSAPLGWFDHSLPAPPAMGAWVWEGEVDWRNCGDHFTVDAWARGEWREARGVELWTAHKEARKDTYTPPAVWPDAGVVLTYDPAVCEGDPDVRDGMPCITFTSVGVLHGFHVEDVPRE